MESKENIESNRSSLSLTRSLKTPRTDRLEALSSLSATRSLVLAARSSLRSAPGLALLHRLLYQTESIVSALLEVTNPSTLSHRPLARGFIESKYSASGSLTQGVGQEDEMDSVTLVDATEAFLEGVCDAAVEIGCAVGSLAKQGSVERFLCVEDNLGLLRAATNDLQYSVQAFEHVVVSDVGRSLPRDVLEDHARLLARIQDAAFVADVDVVAAVQDVVIDVVGGFAAGAQASRRTRRGAVEVMVRMIEADDMVADEWLVGEARSLLASAEVQRANGVFSQYGLFVLVADALLDMAGADDGGVAEAVAGLEGALEGTGRVRSVSVEQLEALEPYERSLALLVLAVTAYEDGVDDDVASRLEVLSASLDFVSGPLTRSMLLLATGKLLADASRKGMDSGTVVRHVASISRWIDSGSANVRRMAATALAGVLPTSAGIELKTAAQALGVGKRLVRQLAGARQDVMGLRATLSALSAMLTDEIAAELARAADGSPDPLALVFDVLRDNLDHPTKGSPDVIRQAVKFVYGLVSRSPLARYRAILANGVPPLERVLASPGAGGVGTNCGNFTLMALYHLSRITSLDDDKYGWSALGIEALLDVLSSESPEGATPASPASPATPTPAQSAAVLTLKHVLSRSDPFIDSEKRVVVGDRHLSALVKLSTSSDSEVESGVATAAALVLGVLVDGGGESSPRMAASIRRMSTDGTLRAAGKFSA